MSFIVAIDGPAGSGKGTITKLAGKKLDLINIDTGAMYRCASLYMIRNNIKLDETEKIAEMLKNIKIEQNKIDDVDKFFLNGEDVSGLIREKEVNEIVSQVSHIVIVRERMVELQREMGKNSNIIMEGRDIGTNVFPNADVKIFLDCSVEERARRRYKQNLEKGINETFEEVLSNIKERHRLETEREVAPFVKAEDAIYIDSSNMTIEEVSDKIIEIIKQKMNKR